jgi:hypothetical protein
MWKMKLIAALALLLSGCAPVLMAQSKANSSAQPLATAHLWIDMSMGPQLVDWFNRTATEQDIARVDHVSMVDVLDDVTVGQRLIVFKNAADAEQLVPRLADKLEIIGYNLEHGPSNRPDEQQDPVGSVRRMRALADQYGKKLALGPDHDFALSAGPAMAPYVDIFVLQIQRVQTEPDTVRDFVLPLVSEIHKANPNVQISVQVRTEGDVKEIASLITSLEESLDGVSILTNLETSSVAEALVAELRPPLALLPTPTSTSSSSSASAPISPLPNTAAPTADLHTGLLATPTTSMRRTVVPLPQTTPIAAPPENSRQPSWLLWAAALALGIVVSGVLATVLIYSYGSGRSR